MAHCVLLDALFKERLYDSIGIIDFALAHRIHFFLLVRVLFKAVENP